KPFSGVTTSIVLYGLGWGLVTYGFLVWLPLNLAKANLSVGSVTAVLAKASYFGVPAAVIVAYLYDRWSSKKTMVLFAGLTGLSLLAFAIEGNKLASRTGLLTFLVVFVLITV